MKRTRRLAAAILSAVMLGIQSAPVCAAEPANLIDVYLDGDKVDFGGVHAQIIHNYAYVPIANIIEKLAGKWPDWDDTTKTASFDFNGSHFSIITSQRGIYINNSFHPYDVPPENVNGRILIPLGMLSNSLSFQQEWDGAARVVKLTSPSVTHEHVPSTPDTSTAPVLLESAIPDRTSVASGDLVTVTVTTSANGTAVKIQDAYNNKVAESVDATMVGNQKVFTLKFVATAGGKFCVYAASQAGYASRGHIDFDLSNAASTSLISVDLSSGYVVLDDALMVTAVTSNDAVKIRLVSDTFPGDIVESTDYTNNGSQRVFRFDWHIRSRDYRGADHINAKVYAVSSSGNTSDYRTVSVKIDDYSASLINEAYMSPQEIPTNSSADIYINTSSLVSRLTFSIDRGDGEFDTQRLTSYQTGRDGRDWQNTFFSSGTTGTTRVLIEAVASNGETSTTTISINVVDPDPVLYGSSGSANIISIGDPKGEIPVGSTVTYSVVTGSGASKVEVNFGSGAIPAALNSTSGGQKYWSASYTFSQESDLYVDIVSYDSNGNTADQRRDEVVVVQY